MRKSNNRTTFKSTYQILKEISEVYDDLADVDQANLTELLAGKYNANILSSLLSDFSLAEDSLKSANESAGSAMRENEVYLESIQGSINRFIAAFQNMSNTVLDSGFVKAIVDVGTAIINLTDSVVGFTGAAPAFATAIASFGAIKMFSGPVQEISQLLELARTNTEQQIGYIVSAGQKLSSIPSKLRGYETFGIGKVDMSGYSEGSQQISDFIMKLANLDEQQRNTSVSLVKLTNTQREYIDTMVKNIQTGTAVSGQAYMNQLNSMNLDEATKQNIVSTLGLSDAYGSYNIVSTEVINSKLADAQVTKTLGTETAKVAKDAVAATVSMQGQAIATKAVTNAQRALNTVMAVGKQLLMSFAVGAVIAGIQALISWVDKIHVSLEEANEKLEQSSTEYDNITSSIESMNSQLNELNSQIKEIQNSGELSLTDEEDLANLKEEKEILEMQLELERMKAEEARKQVVEDTVTAANKYNKETGSLGVSITDVQSYGDTANTNLTGYMNSGNLELLLVAYNQLIKLRDDAFGNPELYNKYNSQLSEVKSQILDISDELMDYKNKLDSVDYDSLTQEQKEMYDSIKESIESILYYTDREYYIRIKVEAEGYEDARQEIIKYAQDNGITSVEDLSYELGNADWSSNTTQFLADMQAAGIGTKSIAASMIDSINGVSDSLENASSSSEAYSNSMASLNEELDTIQDAYKTVRGAIDEYNQSGQLSLDTYQDLYSLGPKWTSCLFDENGQLNINSGTLEVVRNKYADLTSAVYENIEALELRKAIADIEALGDISTASQLGAQADALKEDAEKTKDAGDLMEDAMYEAFKTLQEQGGDQYLSKVTAAARERMDQFYDTIKAIREAREATYLDTDHHLGYNPPSDSGDDGLDEQEKKITDVIGAWDTLSAAMDEYNKTGSITYSTLNSLVGLTPEITSLLQKQGDQLVINADSFRDMIQQQLDETVAAEDATNTADELARMLDWVDQNAVDGTISLEQLKSAIEGVDAAMDDAQSESTTYAEAISGIYNIFASRVPGENFALDQINQIEDYLQVIRKYGENPFTFDVETGEFSVNYDSIRNVLEGQYKELAEQATEAGDAMGAALYGALLESVQNKETPLIDLSSEDNNVLNQFINQTNKFKDGYNLLTKAVDEYNQYHEITSDTYVELMKLMPDYEKYLTIEHGRMKMNTQAYKENFLAVLDHTIEILEADEANAELVESLKKLRDGLGGLEIWFGGSRESVEKFKNAMSQLVGVINKVLDAINDNLQDNANKLQIWGEAIQDEIDDRINALEDQKDALEDMYEDQIEDLEDQKDALEEVNDEQERAIKLAQLQDALERARTAKTVRKYVEGQGYIWTTDEEAIRDAEKELSDQLRDWNQEDANQAIEDEIDKIKDQQQEATDAIDAQIDKLQELKDKYSEILDLIGMDWDDYQEMLKAQAAAQGMTIDEMEAYLSQYKDSVTDNMQEIDRVTDTQEQIQGIQNFIETLKDVWEIISVILDIIDVLSGGGGILGALKKVIGNIFGGDDELEGEGGDKEGSSNIFTNLVDNAKGFFNNLKEKFKTGFDNLTTDTGNFWNGLKEKWKGFTSGFDFDIGGFIDNVKGFFSDGWTKITGGATNFIQGLIQKFTGDGFPTISGSVNDFIQNITGSFTNGFPNLSTIANNFFNNINGFFSNGFNGILSTVNGWIGNLSGIFSTGMNSISNVVTSILGSIGGSGLAGAGAVGAVVGIPIISSGLDTVYEDELQKAQDAFDDGKVLQGIGHSIISGAANATYWTMGGALVDGIKNLFGFKAGTKSVSKSGVYRVDEAGPELIVRSPKAGRLAYLQAGDGVIPSDITSRLFELGADPEAWIRKHSDQSTVVVESHDSGSTVLTIGDIHIHEPVGDADQLARIFVQQLPNKIKQQLNKR